MSETDETQQADPAARVAVIVVSGVGDDRRGEGRDAIVAALSGDPDGRWSADAAQPDLTLIASADSGGVEPGDETLRTGRGAPNLRRPFPVPVAHLVGSDGAPDVDVHEMHWADLSRAQGPVQRIFYLLFAITLQIGTLGLEAVRRFPDELDPGGARARTRLGRVLNAMSYWQAYVITPLILAMLTLAVTVNLELLSAAGWFTSWVLFGVMAVAGAAAASWVAGRIYRGGWTFDRPDAPWAFGTGGFRRVRRRGRIAVQAAVAAVTLGGMAVAIGIDGDHTPVSLRAADALTAVTLSAFRAAWLVMLALAAACAVLAAMLRFRTRPALAANQRLSATVLMTVMLGPVLYALATSVAFLVFAALWRIYPESAKTWPADLRFPRAPGTSIGSPVGEKVPRGSTIDWGYSLVDATIQPLGLALIFTVVILGLIAAFFSRYLRTFRERYRYASAVDVAHEQGAAFSAGLRRTGCDHMVRWAYTPAIVLIALAAVMFWTIPASDDPDSWRHTLGDWGGHLAQFATPVAYVIAVLAVGGVGLRNVGPLARFGGGFIVGLGRVLDFTYDVCSYMRVGNPAIVPPRVQMIARYRALLRHVRDATPGRVVIMAHSQGTILTLAALLGDPDRSPPLGPLPESDRPAAPLTFLSYGTPVTQSYGQRFPGQFAHWTAESRTRIAQWLNVFRAGDYIGRGVGPAPSWSPDVESAHPGGRERSLGPGHHTAYVLDERWRRVARQVVASPDASLIWVPLGDLTVQVLDEPPG